MEPLLPLASAPWNAVRWHQVFLAELDRAVVRGALEHPHHPDPSTVVGREKGLRLTRRSRIFTSGSNSRPCAKNILAAQKMVVFGEMFALSTGCKEESIMIILTIIQYHWWIHDYSKKIAFQHLNSHPLPTKCPRKNNFMLMLKKDAASAHGIHPTCWGLAAAPGGFRGPLRWSPYRMAGEMQHFGWRDSEDCLQPFFLRWWYVI